MNNLRWLEAAERYDAVKKPKAEEAPPLPTLRGFMESEEGEAARTLLAAANESVILGTHLGNYRRIVLRGEGLMIQEGDDVKPISTRDAAKILEKIRKCEPGFEPIIEIRRQLDRIADEAP